MAALVAVNSVVKGINLYSLHSFYNNNESRALESRPKLYFITAFAQTLMMNLSLTHVTKALSLVSTRDFSVLKALLAVPAATAALDFSASSSESIRKIIKYVRPNIGKVAFAATVTAVVASLALGQTLFALSFLATYGIIKLVQTNKISPKVLTVLNPILFSAQIYSLVFLFGGYLATAFACTLVVGKALQYKGYILPGTKQDFIYRNIMAVSQLLLVASSGSFMMTTLTCVSVATLFFAGINVLRNSNWKQEAAAKQNTEHLQNATTLETLENIETIRCQVNDRHVKHRWIMGVKVPHQDNFEELLKLPITVNNSELKVRQILNRYSIDWKNGHEEELLKKRLRDLIQKTNQQPASRRSDGYYDVHDPDILKYMTRYISQQLLKTADVIMRDRMLLNLAVHSEQGYAETIAVVFAELVYKDENQRLHNRVFAYLHHVRREILMSIYWQCSDQLALQGISSFEALEASMGWYPFKESLNKFPMQYPIQQRFQTAYNNFLTSENFKTKMWKAIKKPMTGWSDHWESRQDPTKLQAVNKEEFRKKLGEYWVKLVLLDLGIFKKIT